MLDLVEILKNCPKGTKLYSTAHGEVTLNYVGTEDANYPISVIWGDGTASFTRYGRYSIESDGECILFPSKDQRDWSKFKAPVEKFDYGALKPFDKVLVRDGDLCRWTYGSFSFLCNNAMFCECRWVQGIPYNDETRYLLGTTDMPDEKYIWWE